MEEVSDYRLLVTGSRDWTGGVILDVLNLAPAYADGRRLVIVHGGCKTGADAFADLWARTMGVKTEVHPANWRPNGVYNPQAGLLRNREMVELGADQCLAFIKNGSRGATHCAGLAEEAGIPTVRWSE